MYLGGNPGEYHFLQGGCGLGAYPGHLFGVGAQPGHLFGMGAYPGHLFGLGSYNTDWVNKYQNPFNNNYLFPAAKLGETDPAGAYAMLAPAFAKIQADAIAFVAAAGDKGAAQQTIDGWKKDWPLINGFLTKWQAAAPAAIVAAPAQGGTAQPTTIFQDQSAPAVYGSPAVYGGGSSAPAYMPASSPAVNITTAPAAAAAGDLTATLTEYAPWIAGAAIVGLLLSRGKSSGGGGASKNRPRRRRR